MMKFFLKKKIDNYLDQFKIISNAYMHKSYEDKEHD